MRAERNSQPMHGLPRYLPFEQWPPRMQAAALDLAPEAEKTVGRFLAFLSSQSRSPESIGTQDVLDYAQTLSPSHACRRKHLKRLSAHLPSLLPTSALHLREAVKAADAAHYAEYGRAQARKRCGYRTRKCGWDLGVPVADWPAPWREALEAYQRRLEGPKTTIDLRAALTDSAPEPPRIGRRTLGGITTAVARLLYATRRDPRVSDPDRLAPDTLQSYLDALRERGAKDVTRAIETKFLSSFATHVLRWPAAERQWIKLTYQSLNSRAKTQPRRKDEKPIPALTEVWSTGQELWCRAQALGPGTQTAFRLARDGMVLCFACNAPLRASDLQPLEYERHLLRIEDGWALRVLVQTKTRKEYRNSLLWPEVSAMLDVYRDKWLPERETAYVWMDREPSERWLASVFKNRVGINPHLIRDIVATDIAASGDAVDGVIPSILGHADSRTSAEYIRAADVIVGARVARRLLAQLLSSEA
ncbi:hypothetical protein [Salinarimonas ramus]|uniref:Phage integrase family protein n=1 Tax=Salinarimonas ramus TaxID=690164 RepID=A0A917QIB0_9HYPH|nr:hypothetical protein [Salinarimonas ramus]GGK52610.1 hypothetical protein GCM10011322_44390 [Salinarimonas ramus]